LNSIGDIARARRAPIQIEHGWGSAVHGYDPPASTVKAKIPATPLRTNTDAALSPAP